MFHVKLMKNQMSMMFHVKLMKNQMSVLIGQLHGDFKVTT